MSLYHVQKFLYELNRDEKAQQAYLADRAGVLDGYDLTDEETAALVEPDIGLLFHLGVNGQILMHFAAFHDIAWADYLQLMRDGIADPRPGSRGCVRDDGLRGHRRAHVGARPARPTARTRGNEGSR